MVPLLVLRHAPTGWNRHRLLQGRRDVPLDGDGRSAVATWTLPEDCAGWDWVSSPLSRCRETARLLGHEPRPELRLVEMDWGDWEGHSLAELRATLGPAMAAAEARGLDMRPPGGESPRQVQQRLRPWLAELRRPTVAVTHKGVLRALYALAVDWPLVGRPPVRLADGCAHRFAVEGATVSAVALNLPLTPPVQPPDTPARDP